MSEEQPAYVATKTVYVLEVEDRHEAGGGEIRVYSDRDACLAEGNRIAGNTRIWWALHAVEVDNHRPWFFEADARWEAPQ